MNRRRYYRLLRQSFKIAGVDIVFKAYISYFIVVAFVIWLTEPSISTFFDSMWYCFAVATTIGFGDIAATSFPARCLSIVLSVYSIGVVAIFTAVITSFFMESAKLKASESAREFLYEMEHLPELSKEELTALSEKVKKYAKKLN